MSDDVRPRPTSRTLGDLVDEMATATPGAEALVFCDECLDYAGLKLRVDEFARAFLAVGIRRGDRVALLLTNRTEWIVGLRRRQNRRRRRRRQHVLDAARTRLDFGAFGCGGVGHAQCLSRPALPRRAARPLPRARRVSAGRAHERAAAILAHRRRC